MDFFSNPLESIINVLTSILEFFGGLVESLINALSSLLQYLFIPEEDYFDNMIGMLSDTLNERIKTQDYQELLESLQVSTRASSLPNMTATFFGQKVTIVDMSIYSNYQSTIYSWVRGTMFILLLFYNVNNIYKLIRGGSLQDGKGNSSAGSNTTGGNNEGSAKK